MIGNLEGLIRQAKQDKLSYEEFLLNLSEAEVQTRQENGRKRRLREAKFPILKPMETFNFDAAPELDVRLMKELSSLLERNKAIFRAVRSAVCFVIGIRRGNNREGMGDFGCLPRDVVLMIATRVWETRGDSKWLAVLGKHVESATESKRAKMM